MPIRLGLDGGGVLPADRHQVMEMGIIMNTELMECTGCGLIIDRTETKQSRGKGDKEVDYRCLLCEAECLEYDYDYVCQCPKCHSNIVLVSCVVTTHIQVSPSGWPLNDGSFCDTTDEKFFCDICQRPVPIGWVFGKMKKQDALKKMESRSTRG